MDGKPPAVLKQNTESIKKLAAENLMDGRTVLVSGVGEYNDNCVIWKLTPAVGTGLLDDTYRAVDSGYVLLWYFTKQHISDRCV